MSADPLKVLCARCGAEHADHMAVRAIPAGTWDGRTRTTPHFVCVDRDACDATIAQRRTDAALDAIDRT